MVPTVKLTKRQKKGIAFRERKHNKGKDNLLSVLEDEIDVPSLEDQALVAVPQGSQGRQVSANVSVGERKRGEEANGPVVVAGKKRKKKAGEEEEAALGEPEQPKSKRRKGIDKSPVVDMKQSVEVEGNVRGGEAERQSKRTKQRFILFLGNLKYTTTSEAIQTHFSACAPPPTVRLLTPKPSVKSLVKSVVKSKGCAFLEFTHRSALQQGLKLHHSQLDGRQINVELTAGGGGKGSTRIKKLNERNKGLQEQRRKRQSSSADAPSSNTRRFSATSGIEATPTHKRTWTIGDIERLGTHRGGRKYRSSRKQKLLVKDFRTGVNAIPVG